MPTRPDPGRFLVAWYDCRDVVLAGERGYNSRTPATLSSRERARLKAHAHPLEPVRLDSLSGRDWELTRSRHWEK
jgi:hypothetical protein